MTIAGISGVKRNAAAAVAIGGRLAASCEEGRVTRVRDIGIRGGGFPRAALRAAMAAAGVPGAQPAEIVGAERGLEALGHLPIHTLDHHFGHAATAFLTSPFERATVLVCDTSEAGDLTIWRGHGSSLQRVNRPWEGPGFARLYSRLTALLGLEPGSEEYSVEALARLGGSDGAGAFAPLLQYGGDRLLIDEAFDERVVALGFSVGTVDRGGVAAAVQQRLGELLLELLGDVARETGDQHLCLGGGLFFNTCLNTLVRQAGPFPHVFVPVNPGNSGVAAGSALARSLEVAGVERTPQAVSPFLGPEYSTEEIKGVLDNCKLSYDFLDDAGIVDWTVRALGRGEIVGWFRGRLEWGTRALGSRSIFANPFMPYVLENLNRFLKHREAYRIYGLAACEEDVANFFEGPAASPFMECEYEIRDRDRFRHALPGGMRGLRVQTVGTEPAALRHLLKAFGDGSGTPVLINTSFNGFHEPIVCSPRDAVRVFYGTGLDAVVIGNFVLHK